MPFVTSSGARLYWRGEGDPARPAVVLLNSLGTDMALWDRVVPKLLDRHRVLRMDTRGHGASEATPGDYSLPLLAGDVLAVLDAAGVERAAVCGVSLGGMIGQWLALHRPERLSALVACNTSSRIDPSIWTERIRLVREQGMAAIADGAIERFFSPGFRASGSPVVASARATLLGLDREGYAGCCAAIRDMALGDAVAAIGVPTLVVNGAEDVSTPPAEHGEVIARTVPNARSVTLRTGHLSPYEVPDALAAAVLAFLDGGDERRDRLDEARAALFDNGIAYRRQVLGDPWVERSLARRHGFSGEFQELITRYAWGEIWSRPGLDHRTRRLLVLATTIALGRWEEFRLHVRAGIEQNGFSVADLKEVVLQSAVYAGVPAANTASHHAEEVLAALGSSEA